VDQKTYKIEPDRSLGTGVHAEFALQTIVLFSGEPCLRLIKRTRKNTQVIGNWKADRGAFTVDEVADTVNAFGVALLNELTLTRGVQLALPLD
jgi:hypothetical protein